MSLKSKMKIFVATIFLFLFKSNADTSCDFTGLQEEWIPCSMSQACENPKYPLKMVSLKDVCPTGCRCYVDEDGESPVPSQYSDTSRPPSGPDSVATCNGGWFLMDGMCYTLTDRPVAGHDLVSACAEMGGATPVYGTSEGDSRAVVRVLESLNRPLAWAILQAKIRPAAADWTHWFKCLSNDCKCTTISADSSQWTSRNCDTKYPAACRREPRYQYWNDFVLLIYLLCLSGFRYFFIWEENRHYIKQWYKLSSVRMLQEKLYISGAVVIRILYTWWMIFIGLKQSQTLS